MLSGLNTFAMVVEKEPLKLDDLPTLFVSWLQNVGGFAAVALAVVLLSRYFLRDRTSAKQRPGLQAALASSRGERPAWLRLAFVLLVVLAAVFYNLWGLLAMMPALAKTTAGLPDFCLTAGGACALLAVLLPFLHDLSRVRFRRVWALAQLSFREAMRRKIYIAFCALLLVLLFADWFMPHKPENQLRNYVTMIYWSMTPLLLFIAALLAAFSIPSDIRNQTIHTIVTKPVERFEIVLGRFLGYVCLFSLTLFVMCAVALPYVWIVGVHPDAQFESYRARVPIYGELRFHGKQADFKGDSVGREWEYRRYIAGGPNSSHRAIWLFRELPTRLDERSTVPCEFAFDIFRTTKGEVGKGVFCTFTFQTRNWNVANLRKLEAEREAARRQPNPPSDAEIDNELAKKYGYYEFRSKEISDYHTFTIEVPVGLFQNAQESPDGSKPKGDAASNEPVVAVVVKCESPSQFVGVAKHDLYLLDAEGYFALNFFKGAAGLWLRLCLVIGLAVACSTYLSGIISFMNTMFLVGLGLCSAFILTIALGTNEGGGPGESFLRLVNNQNQVTPLDANPVTTVASAYDEGFRWFLRRFIKMLPDMDYYDLSGYVAEGFDIALGDLAMHLLVLFGYLLPWFVLAYYLLKTREIASG